MTTRKPNNRITMIIVVLMAIAVASPYIDLSNWSFIAEPAGPRQIVVLYETGDSTWQWNAMMLALRTEQDKTENQLFLYDDDTNLSPELKQLFDGKNLPVVSILSAGGKVLFTGDMPKDIESVNQLIQKYGG